MVILHYLQPCNSTFVSGRIAIAENSTTTMSAFSNTNKESERQRVQKSLIMGLLCTFVRSAIDVTAQLFERTQSRKTEMPCNGVDQE